MLKGIDVSHHNYNKAIENIVKSCGLDFLVAKATEGKSYRDKEFDYYMSLAYANGLLRGAYHYVNPKDILYATNEVAMWEATNFVSCIRPYGDTIPILDFEESFLLCNEGVRYLTCVAYAVKSYSGTAPIIYLSESVLLTNNFAEIADMGCGIWVAKWGKNNPIKLADNAENWIYTKAQSGDFSVVAMQQIASKASVDNTIIALDVDVASMSTDAWCKYANPRLYAK